ncbi:hypothetical protein [Frigidibacter sp. MR17.24]|uniref:hypothetical protein n=1 Tax=Frigidibacter sp. MR17.24 TaxID=3127345 RepID=UPI003012B802
MAGFGISLLQASAGGGVTRAGVVVGGAAGSGAPGSALVELLELTRDRRLAATPGTGRAETVIRAAESGSSTGSEAAAREVARLRARAAEYQGALNRLAAGRTTLLAAGDPGSPGPAVAISNGPASAGASDPASDPASGPETAAEGGDPAAVAAVPARRDDAAPAAPGPGAEGGTDGATKGVGNGVGGAAIADPSAPAPDPAPDPAPVAAGEAPGEAGGVPAGGAPVVQSVLGRSVQGADLQTALARLADLRATEAAARFRIALSGTADIDGGDGFDAIIVPGAGAISLGAPDTAAGGTRGSDPAAAPLASAPPTAALPTAAPLAAAGRSLGLHGGLGDGHDIVSIAPGTDVVLQLAPAPGRAGAAETYTVTRGADSLRLEFEGGSVTFTRVGEAGLIAVQGPLDAAPRILSTPVGLDLTV